MRVDFPDGQWAEIYGVLEMPRRVTARIEDMLGEMADDWPRNRSIAHIARMRDTLMAMVVKQWSYGDKPAEAAEGVHDMPQAAYDKLREATEDHWEKAGFTKRATEETPPEQPGSETNSDASISSA